jgi:hypothetical protein
MNCPACKKSVSEFNYSGVNLAPMQYGGAKWKGIAISCPLCSAVVGAQIDPIAIKTDIVSEVLRALGK